ncbi:MAG: hypothetical protein KKD44_17350 [Proteobacteria bacterium]|nr:hypothetical protein [Pseudomonadota bacterium]
MTEENTVAQTIYEQIGGRRFEALAGVVCIKKKERSLEFIFMKCRKANLCRIELTPMDLYTMVFIKVKWKKAEESVVETFEYVYWDQLEQVFEDFTGLK